MKDTIKYIQPQTIKSSHTTFPHPHFSTQLYNIKNRDNIFHNYCKSKYKYYFYCGNFFSGLSKKANKQQKSPDQLGNEQVEHIGQCLIGKNIQGKDINASLCK